MTEPIMVGDLPSTRRPRVEMGFAETLQSNPNKWFELDAFEKESTASSRRTVYTAHLGEQGFQFATRRVDGMHRVYGAYVVPEKKAAKKPAE